MKNNDSTSDNIYLNITDSDSQIPEQTTANQTTSPIHFFPPLPHSQHPQFTIPLPQEPFIDDDNENSNKNKEKELAVHLAYKTPNNTEVHTQSKNPSHATLVNFIGHMWNRQSEQGKSL